jgi:hypothetical protein
MASFMTLMQNQENVFSFFAKMSVKIWICSISFFCRNMGTNQLTINSEHRLPRVLDDQILMYKMVSTNSKFINILKKKSNFRYF